MGEAAILALGICIGMIIYWVVYRLFWHRWHQYQERDLTYLGSKLDSAQFTTSSLERQIAAQKVELAEQRQKITSRERDLWLAQSRLAELNTDKQMLISHLDALRAEMLAPPQVGQDNAPMVSSNGSGNGKTHVPFTAAEPLESATFSILPMTGFVENGQQEAPQAVPTLPNAHLYASPDHFTDQVLEPVLLIARPRMCGDRLDIIPGIGTIMVKKLNRAGIDTFHALSQLTPERLIKITGSRAARLMDAEQVILQAKKFASDRRLRKA